MKKYEKEILENRLDAEESERRHLKAIYNKAAEDITKKINISNGKIEVLLQNWDDLSDEEKSIYQSQIYQRDFQKSLKSQIDGFLEGLNDEQYKSIEEYMKNCYEDGFIGAMYSIHKQGVPLIMPIDQKKVIKAMFTDSKISKKLYTKLGEDVDFLKKRIANNLSRGIATASSYSDIARNIANDSNVGFNRAMRIARTEGTRISNQSAFDASLGAKERGSDVVKMWDSTLDGKTRTTHRQLDGQIRELEEPFEVGGMKAMYPADFGRASEDVNCRCALLQRARWALDDGEFTKMNNFTKELETFESPKSYDEFKKGFFSDENVEYMNYIQQKEKKYKTKDFRKVLENMTTREYNHYSEMLGGNPVFNRNVLISGGKSNKISSDGKSFKKIQTSHTINDDIGTKQMPVCNPNFSKGGDYILNCGNCSATYEMRRRGYDVIANPMHTMLVSVWQDLFKDAKPFRVPWRRGEKYFDTLSKSILKRTEDGARGSIFVKWKGRRVGHFFSWEVKDGKVFFVDAQNGNIDASEYFDRIKPSETICVRWDNLEPSEKIKDACKNRGGD